MSNQIVKNLKIGNAIYTLDSSSSLKGSIKIFENIKISPSNFTLDSSIDSSLDAYIWKGTISLPGITQNMCPSVIFSISDITKNIFSPLSKSFDGGIYIFAAEKPKENITIPTIIAWKTI